MPWHARLKHATPIVIDKIDLTRFLQDLVNYHEDNTTLLVCASKDDFLNDMYQSIYQDCLSKAQEGTSTNPINVATQSDEASVSVDATILAQHPLIQPTLHMLASTKTIKAVFCPSVPHTLAYLTNLVMQEPSYPTPQGKPDSAQIPQLAILNPLRQHRDTGSFSGQGLSKFFSMAYAAADATNCQLVIAECPGEAEVPAANRPTEDMDEDLFAPIDEDPGSGSDRRSVWDEEVPMVNVKTKTFGIGEKGWRGRAVTLRRIAERWCEVVVVS